MSYSIRIATLSVIFLVGAFGAAGVSAQGYPNKPIRMIVGETAGTTPDVIPRVLAPHMSRVLGQPIIVENRPGAGSLIAYEYVATRTDPDGYTVLTVSLINLALLPLTVKDIKFDPLKDLPPVIGVAEGQYILVSSSQKPWTTFAEFVEYAKKNPGKVNIGSVAQSTRMATEVLVRSVGINTVVVPYPTGAQYSQALLNGEADAIITSVLAVEPYGERVRILAISGDSRRAPHLAIPTFREVGVTGIHPLRYSFNARAGTPAPVVERIHAAASEALRLPEVQAQFAKLRLAVVDSTSAVAARQQAEVATVFAEMANALGLKPQ